MRHVFQILVTEVIAAIVALLLGFPGGVGAETLTPEETAQVCRNWLSYVVHQRGNWAGDASPRIEGVHRLSYGDTLLASVFEIHPRGHVVVPLSRELSPIKASSETSRFDPDAPHGFPALVKEEILSRERFPSARKNHPGWDAFLASDDEFRRTLTRDSFAPLEEVGPLLTTSWHQQEPYSGACPDGDGGRCLVGCVALAVSQLMRYHQWPPCGVGGQDYRWNGDQSCGGSTDPENLSADFPDPYDWPNMPDACAGGCTPEEEAAVGELCYEAGAALQTDFGACNSLAALSDVLSVLPLHFRYDNTMGRADRVDYTLESWFGAIQAEINAGRPVLYSIRYSSTGSHVLVCDGWRDAGGQLQYHVNYGWGGAYTGWYAVDEIYHAVDPMQEYAILGISPRPVQVLHVNPEGTAEFATIQDAIHAAAPGDTVVLAPGVFTGIGNRDIDLPDKGLVIVSAEGNPDTCVIDCQGLGRAFSLYSTKGTPSVLEGVTIVHGSAELGGGVFVGHTSPTFIRCVFRDNYADESGGAMYWDHNSSPSLQGCVFLGNSATKGGGIWCKGASEALLSGCTFCGNSATLGGALYCTFSSSPTIENTIIAFGDQGSPITCDETSDVTLRCCDVYGHPEGDWTGCIGGYNGSDGNISMDPRFCDPVSGDVAVAQDSPCAAGYSPPGCGRIGAGDAECVDFCQGIPLGAGWNCVSTCVQPLDPAMATIWAGVIADGRLNIVKSSCVEEFCLPGTICDKEWDPLSCYMAHLSAPSVLSVCGTATPEEGPVPLEAGWNCMPYLPQLPIPPETALGDCWSALNILQSHCTGDFCIPGIYCGIEMLNPAACYMVHMSDACDLHFFTGDFKSDITGPHPVDQPSPSHFEVHGYTGSSYSVVVRSVPSVVRKGDEVGVFCGNLCVGARVWGDGSVLGISVWGDDPATDEIDGGVAGDLLEFRLWDSTLRIERPLEVDFAVGSGTYGHGPYSIANVKRSLVTVEGHPEAVLPTSFSLTSITPNPFGPLTEIACAIPAGSGPDRVRVNIYNAAGRRMATLVDDIRGPGTFSTTWDGRDSRGIPVASGVYFCRAEWGGMSRTRRLVRLR